MCIYISLIILIFQSNQYNLVKVKIKYFLDRMGD